MKLIPRCISISLNNLPKMNHDIINTYVKKLRANSLLMKLRISNMSLNNQSIVRHITETIKNCKVLQLVNLSWAYLSPENLAEIVKSI